MEIRRAKPDEGAVLTEIATAAKRYWGYPERWMALWAYSLTIEPDYIRSHPVYAACQEGQILGFYALTGSGPVIELDHLWVRPELIRQGVGQALFADAVRRAEAGGAASLTIQAEPHAEGFYLRMGARRVGSYEYELDGQHRELPKMQLDLEPKRTDQK